MSLKFALVIVFIALAGQGFAWPRSQPEESEENVISYSLRAAAPFLQSKYGVVDGVKHCWTTVKQKVATFHDHVTAWKRTLFSIGTARQFWIAAGTSIFETDSGARENSNVIAGLQRLVNIYSRDKVIFVHLKNQVALFFKAKTLKFPLFGRVVTCFFKKDFQETYDCGSTTFKKYFQDATQIEHERTVSRNELHSLVKGFPKCLAGPGPEQPNPTGF